MILFIALIFAIIPCTLCFRVHSTRNADNTNMFHNELIREHTIHLFDSSNNTACGKLISDTFPQDPRGGCLSYTLGDNIQAHPACYDLWSKLPSAKHFINKVIGFGGVFGSPSLMSKADYIMLDFLFAGNRYLKNIMEFGTAFGTTSLYLGMVSRMRGGQFITYDYLKTDCRGIEIKRGWLDNMEFKQADILATTQACPRRGALELVGDCTPCAASVTVDVSNTDLLFIDNGEKIREASLYAKYVRLGGFVIVAHSSHLGIQKGAPLSLDLP